MLKLLAFMVVSLVVFFLLAAASGWLNGDDVVPGWLILFGLPLSLYVAYRLGKSMNEEPAAASKVPAVEPQKVKSPPKIVDEKEIRQHIEERKRIERLDDESHDFIIALCKAKGVEIDQFQRRIDGGHYEAPEIREFDKPLPITDDEKEKSDEFDNLEYEFYEDENDRKFCTSFKRQSDWFFYQIAKKSE